MVVFSLLTAVRLPATRSRSLCTGVPPGSLHLDVSVLDDFSPDLQLVRQKRSELLACPEWRRLDVVTVHQRLQLGISLKAIDLGMDALIYEESPVSEDEAIELGADALIVDEEAAPASNVSSGIDLTAVAVAPDEGGSSVDFTVDFSFRNAIFEALAGQFFETALRKMTGAFIKRADSLYGVVGSSNSSA